MATISQPKVAKKKAKNKDSSSDEDSDDDTKRQEKKTDHNAPIETMLDFSYRAWSACLQSWRGWACQRRRCTAWTR